MKNAEQYKLDDNWIIISGYIISSLFAIFFYILSKTGSVNIGLPVFITSLTPIFISAYILGKVRVKREKEKQELESKQQTQNFTDHLLIIHVETYKIFHNNLKTLILKFEQKIIKDDYGIINFEKAFCEVEYFIKNVVYNNLKTKFLEINIDKTNLELSLQHILFTDDNLKNILKELTYMFSKISNQDEWNEAYMEFIGLRLASCFTAYVDASDEIAEKFLTKDYKEIKQNILEFSNFNTEMHAEEDLHLLKQNLLKTDFFNKILAIFIDQDEVKNLKSWLLSRHSNDHNLDEIKTGLDFEALCQKKLQALGWKVKTTNTTNDFGADLLAERDGKVIAIQCKHWSQPIGVKAVQEAYSAKMYYSSEKAAVIASSEFTKSAKQMAQKNNVQLLHVHELELLNF